MCIVIYFITLFGGRMSCSIKFIFEFWASHDKRDMEGLEHGGTLEGNGDGDGAEIPGGAEGSGKGRKGGLGGTPWLCTTP